MTFKFHRLESSLDNLHVIASPSKIRLLHLSHLKGNELPFGLLYIRLIMFLKTLVARTLYGCTPLQIMTKFRLLHDDVTYYF